MKETMPPHIKRFILTSIDSVPHLEAILLLRADPQIGWTAKEIAQNLFVAEKKACELLEDLAKAGFASAKEEALYFYDPASPKLKDMVDELAELYPRNLIEITNLIHSNISKQAQKFGDAFKWQGEED
ncbi:MAG TPA: hypothetical protein VL404_08540 [Candidatus Eisenbacteria bacterium]|jgi:hypothetical protein|nr:hypothetical protein [Candidatus Eisenbacteria bacterium]